MSFLSYALADIAKKTIDKHERKNGPIGGAKVQDKLDKIDAAGGKAIRSITNPNSDFRKDLRSSGQEVKAEICNSIYEISRLFKGGRR